LVLFSFITSSSFQIPSKTQEGRKGDKKIRHPNYKNKMYQDEGTEHKVITFKLSGSA
jgi:hypothetical protein